MSTPTGSGNDSAESSTGGTYRTLAVVLALIVTAALAYGLVQTGLKASALFTG